jgi:site-specific recombinase XerD
MAFEELRTRCNPVAGLVFRDPEGVPYKKTKRWFEAAVKASGIASFTWNCLRHTFASRLVMAGVNLRTVRELMGHLTISMTARYAHLSPEFKLSAVTRMAEWSDAQNVQRTDTKTHTAHEPETLNIM